MLWFKFLIFIHVNNLKIINLKFKQGKYVYLFSKFQCLTWEDDDLGIYLGTSDGAVYYNKLEDPSVRLQILSVPGFSVKSIISLFVNKD